MKFFLLGKNRSPPWLAQQTFFKTEIVFVRPFIKWSISKQGEI